MYARRGSLTFLVFAVVALIGATDLAAQEEGGRVLGRAVNGTTAQPLAGAQVFIPGTALGTLTNQEGQFLLLNVPAGEHTVRLELIGYRTAEQIVTVAAGGSATANFELEQAAISLDRIVVTGVLGETEQAKLPFTVAQVTAADIPVPQASVISSLQGKVAGVTVVQGSGRPGEAPSLLLRGVTAISADDRNQEPLYIVDGVILGSSVVDIGSLDVESVEIVKGAAASSLYGSRAANGVVQITTKRGRGVANNEVRYTVRSEAGFSQISATPPSLLPEHHEWQLTEDGSQFVDGEGNGCDWLTCDGVQQAGSDAWDTYMIHEWPGGGRDQVAEMFTDGAFAQHYFSASGRSGATNFHASYAYVDNEGVLPGLAGLQRHNVRINVDQAIQENIFLSMSAFYSRSEQDTGGAELFGLTRMPAGVNLWSCDPALGLDSTDCSNNAEGLILVPDPTNLESANPIYNLLNTDDVEKRGRFLGSGNLRYSPMSWIDLEANMSYDRADEQETQFTPKGFRTPTSEAEANDGNLDRNITLQEALNSSATATFRFDLTDGIRNSTQVRYLYERDDYRQTNTEGYDFAVRNVPTFNNINEENLEATSQRRVIHADGYFLITKFDMNRYIINLLARNDGSSLFGEDERRHWYYRVGAAWRPTEEPWFDVPLLDELKLRYSLGTAGDRPSFVGQYETFDVDGGTITPVALGNKDLKPAFSREQEMGIDAVAFGGRLGLTLTYANNVISDQILQVPLLGPTGYDYQYRNAGTLESNTWEASLEAQLVQTPNLSWSARVIYDRTRSEITELNTAPFTIGVGGQGLGGVFYAREGEEYGTFYGVQFAENCGHLPGDLGVGCDQFRVNDQGLLVWTGGEDLSADSWGNGAGFNVFGKPVMWGTPMAGECTDPQTGGPTYFCEVGNSMPDYHLVFSTDVTYHGLTAYAMVDAVQGFDVYNQPLQWAVFQRTAGVMDQADLPEQDRKPLGYWDATYGISGLGPSSYYVEDGSFIKLRQVSLRYRFGADQLAQVPGLSRLSGLALTAIGRNLFTHTDYRGYDPEVGETGGDVGSAAVARVDGFQYPNFRTWTLGVEVNF